jgi:hypothetical protein
VNEDRMPEISRNVHLYSPHLIFKRAKIMYENG